MNLGTQTCLHRQTLVKYIHSIYRARGSYYGYHDFHYKLQSIISGDGTGRDLLLVTGTQPTAPSIGRSKGIYNWCGRAGAFLQLQLNLQLMLFLSCHSI